jgi:ornithine carbamoyltransferase
MNLYRRNLLKVTDLSREEFGYLLDLAELLRAEKRHGHRAGRLTGRSIALLFQKPSTRTRAAFEVAAHDEGGQVSYFGPGDTHLGRKESARDTARVLGRMFDGIGFRGASQDLAEQLGAQAGVPVWNGLTDAWHPTQMLADMLTIRDHASKPLPGISLCYLGDAGDASSVLVTGALMGLDVRLCSPPSMPPAAGAWAIATALSAESGARLAVTDSIGCAVTGADFLYTDIWLRTTAPPQVQDERIGQLIKYQVTAEMLAATGNPAVKFLHPLPSLHDLESDVAREVYRRHGIGALEVTGEVFGSPASVVFDQAENRLHTIKAVLVATLCPEPGPTPAA